MWQSPYCPPAAALLLVLALPLGHAAEGFPVSHLRPDQLGMHAVLARQPSQQNFQVPLAHPVNQGLAQLGVVLEVEGRVLLVQLVEARGELVFLAPLLDQHGGCGFPSGNSIGGRRTGWSLRLNVSLVWVSRSLATEPMSPGESSVTSWRSLPCCTERWFSFSETLCSAFQTSSPVRRVPV